MQHFQAIIDSPASHLTLNEVLKLARDHGAQPFDLGDRIHIRRGSFTQDFKPTPDSLFRAGPIRSWLGV